jgi:signal transduction histidine kinase
MRGVRDWLSLFAAVGNLFLTVTALRGARRSPLARPLAALCFVLFGWNFSTLADHLSRASGANHGDSFAVLDAFFTALSPPLLLEVVLGFVGESRRSRVPRALAWMLFGGLALASLGALLSPEILRWSDSVSWFTIFLAGYLPTLTFEVIILGRYLRRTTEGRETARTRLVLLALAIGGAFSMSDVARGAGLPTPYLGALGTFIAAALLTMLVLRLELFDRNVPIRTTIYALGMIVAFVVAYLVALSAFAGHVAVQLLAGCILTALALAVARELAHSIAEARARTKHLALLGRFSAQMTHDLKGPLTALLGAAQVLEHDGDDAETRREFIALISEQARRMARIVDEYDRMTRVEPRKTLVRIDTVVRSVALAHGVPPSAIVLAGDAAELLECDADPVLLESALENVVRNAVEAAGAPTRGTDAPAGHGVRIETQLDRANAVVVVRVIDRGAGMDARVLARATEEFFTTKPDGSGLGLAFARRVLEAHGGALTLTSQRAPQPDHGTTVELRIPR